jgi:internalin A
MTKLAPNEEPQIAEVKRRIAVCRAGKETLLDLGHLGLRDLPEGVRSLRWLNVLQVRKNRLRRLPEWIGELTQLRQLLVWSNPLETIPASITKLTSLEVLSISDCSDRAEYEIIGAVDSLTHLIMNRMELTAVPSWIRRLRNLKELVLQDNQLVDIPNWLPELHQLEDLALEKNNLSTLPGIMRDMPALHTLTIDNNPRLGLPPEIVDSGDARKILSYYFRTLAGTRTPLNEFKLVLLGRGGVGKTTLVHRLITDNYKQFKRTPGIKISQWPIKIDGSDVRAHIWDFGGQEIMHGTHRFFMTARALYLVLLSGREGTEDRDADYWLSLARSFAGNVPVIVLLHKWDDYRFELNRGMLREKYGQSIVFVETDSSTGYGIDDLRKQICQLANKLHGLRAAWPAEWWRIKEVLPAKRTNWLTFEDFCSFACEQGVSTPQDQEALAASLHDLGLMLSYRKEDTLRDFGVLNPQWVTKGIYAMLNAPALRDVGGKFTVKAFAEVLSAKTYPLRLHPYLLALMRKFEICHPLDDRGEKHLIPDLLTKEEPDLEPDFPANECLGFVYQYGSVLPEGLLPRFIVQTYVHREPKHAWRTGAVLERANCRALIRGDIQGRTITIRVVGPTSGGRRELLGIVREHFERIHRSYEKLPVTELVPIPGHPDVHVEHELLITYERSFRRTITVKIDKGLRDFRVKDLLDGVDLPGLSRGSGDGAFTRRPGDKDMNTLSLFISYSHKDATFLDQLRGALVPYERKDELKVWADPLVEPGQAWESEILGNLERADLVILLLSNDFMRSYYCMDKELKRAVERHERGECELVPVVVRACRFEKLELGRIQAILPGGKSVKQYTDRDRAWLEVTKQIDRVIARVRRK